MAKTTNIYTIEIGGNKFSAPTQAEALAMAQAFCGKPTTAGKGKTKTVEYKKENGTTVMATPAQAKAWDAWKENGKGKGTREENLKVWEDKRAAYKPTKEFKDAIKADRSKITLDIAKKQYGFVGTKKDLAALKDSICK